MIEEKWEGEKSDRDEEERELCWKGDHGWGRRAKRFVKVRFG